MAVYDPAGAAPKKRLYVNGALNASKTLTTALLYDTSSAGDFYLGQAGAGGQYYKGNADDVRVYSRALTAADIVQIYKGGQRITPSGTQTLSGSLTTAGDVVLAGGTLDVSETGCSGASCSIAVGGSWYNHGGDFSSRAGTVTLSGTSASGAIRTDRDAFYNLTFSSTGTYTLQDRLYVLNTLTMSGNGTLANAGYPVHAETVTKTTGTFSGSGVLVLDATSDQSLRVSSTAMPVRIESTLDNGLVGYWKFDEGRSIYASDLSGNGNNGTIVNGGAYDLDVPSGLAIDNASSIVLDGTTQYVNIGTPAVLNFAGAITMAAWVKVTQPTDFAKSSTTATPTLPVATPSCALPAATTALELGTARSTPTRNRQSRAETSGRGCISSASTTGPPGVSTATAPRWRRKRGRPGPTRPPRIGASADTEARPPASSAARSTMFASTTAASPPTKWLRSMPMVTPVAAASLIR
ncbi:MAG TPA: LamG-like jellyroll fold domain-containing protein [Polyangia bacterium]